MVADSNHVQDQAWSGLGPAPGPTPDGRSGAPSPFDRAGELVARLHDRLVAARFPMQGKGYDPCSVDETLDAAVAVLEMVGRAIPLHPVGLAPSSSPVRAATDSELWSGADPTEQPGVNDPLLDADVVSWTPSADEVRPSVADLGTLDEVSAEVVAEASDTGEAGIDVPTEPEPESAGPGPAPGVEPERGAVARPEPEPEPVPEPEPEPVPEPEPEPEPEPDPVPEPEPDAASEAKPSAVSETEVEAHLESDRDVLSGPALDGLARAQARAGGEEAPSNEIGQPEQPTGGAEPPEAASGSSPVPDPVPDASVDSETPTQADRQQALGPAFEPGADPEPQSDSGDPLEVAPQEHPPTDAPSAGDPAGPEFPKASTASVLQSDDEAFLRELREAVERRMSASEAVAPVTESSTTTTEPKA